MASPRKLRCQITRLIDHGDRVYTLQLKPEKPVPRFKPGQFMHLALDEYDPSRFWPESRVFSIASSPNERDCLQITYSVIGSFTTRMEQEQKEGRWIWTKLPYGDFVIKSSKDVVLFAGGTGITAFTAFIAGLNQDYSHQVNLFYGARNPELLIYKSMLERVTQRCKQLHINYFVEQGLTESKTKNIQIGRLSIERTWPKIQSPLESDYYLSGPPTMLKVLSNGLQKLNIQKDVIFIDAWE